MQHCQQQSHPGSNTHYRYYFYPLPNGLVLPCVLQNGHLYPIGQPMPPPPPPQQPLPQPEPPSSASSDPASVALVKQLGLSAATLQSMKTELFNCEDQINQSSCESLNTGSQCQRLMWRTASTSRVAVTCRRPTMTPNNCNILGGEKSATLTPPRLQQQQQQKQLVSSLRSARLQGQHGSWRKSDSDTLLR
ncbi:hypothetical protein BOX15_Mlig033421g1 [Macrostomum lignano]|uniref:Uncharacterized protein n=1 Tax=Macrostomum lignano TaxID=282301 RepID=A0A267EGF4_9PLAT|nr:hypothetical protein BOX15_Mlig033421g1 [Macrostomum lignano]